MNRLTGIETTALAECEAVIERGLATFVEVGQALLRIRGERLYRTTHKSFEDYCRERWGWSRRNANYQIQAAEVVRNLGTTVPKVNDITERQARELVGLSPEQQREVASKIDFGQATSQEVRAAVKFFRETGTVPDTGMPLGELRDGLRAEMHAKFPSPAAARRKAIETGKHTKDWNGDYQPPMSKSDQAEAREEEDQIRPLAHFIDWVGVVTPREVAEIASRRHWIDWVTGDGESDLSGACEWLVEFRNEMKRFECQTTIEKHN